jgi:hypothetical protein
MNYEILYTYNKDKYTQLMNNTNTNNVLIHVGGAKNKNKKKSKIKSKSKNKCIINTTDKIVFGSGGSKAIIVITDTTPKRVFKMIPIFYSKLALATDKDHRISMQKKNINDEVKIYEKLTKNIIDTGISEHYVKFYNAADCSNTKVLFDKCPSYVEWLQMPPEQKKSLKICDNLMRGHPFVNIDKDYKTIELEYCDYNCGDFVEELALMSPDMIETHLDIFLFQILYTLLVTVKIYPKFVHNDLFIRNILGNKEKDTGKYYEYHYEGKTYYVPQKRFFPKINDFGYTNLDDTNHANKIDVPVLIDFYNIVIDIYDGQNFGANSLMSLLHEQSPFNVPDLGNMNKSKLDDVKIRCIRQYFSTFLNVDKFDELKRTSQKLMDVNWGHIADKEFREYIEFADPKKLMEYFYNIFGKKNNIIMSFGQ